MDPILEASNLSLQIGARTLCSGLELQLCPGQSLAVLGQNGTGKTTLLHALLGLRETAQGEVRIDGRTLDNWSRKALAARVGMLFQSAHDEMPASVLEIALMGRYPHAGGWPSESAEDVRLARAALAEMGLGELAQREIRTLSGGERQRLSLAMLLTQSPQLYLLDEPSNHLDIGFQLKVIEALKRRLKDDRAALVLATHDINLAARFCEQILLFLGDGRFVHGAREQVLTEANLSAAYDCLISRTETASGLVFYPR